MRNILWHFVRNDWDRVYVFIQAESARLINSPENCPPLVAQRLLVSGEDHRHGLHPGFDSIAICRAVWRRLTSVSREGASTIEQQLVRTITGRYERTLRRKLTEIILAILVDASFDKRVLPAVYLSIAYYGWRMNGYRQACRRLGFRPHSLTLDQAAALVSRLKYPEPRVPPIVRLRQINRRTEHLLNLYESHIHAGNYKHLESTSFFNQSRSFQSAHSISDSGSSLGCSLQRRARREGDLREIVAERRSSVFVPRVPSHFRRVAWLAREQT